MKNQKLIAAVVLLALGFASCQKDPIIKESELVNLNKELRPAAQTAKLVPQLLHDGHSIIYKVFTYDSKWQLSGIEEPGKGKLVLNRDASGRVVSIAHFTKDGMNTTTDFLQYDRINKPVKVVTMAGHNETIIKSREIIYDAMQRKIDEKETSIDAIKEWKYNYDAQGNIATIYKILNGELSETVTFSNFTDVADPFVNVPDLSLLPFEFNQRVIIINKTVESHNELKKYLIRFALNNYGYAATLSEHLNLQENSTDPVLFIAYSKF